MGQGWHLLFKIWVATSLFWLWSYKLGWDDSAVVSILFCLFVCFKPASHPPQLSCCGIQSYTNWSTSPYFFKHGIPTSCCMNSSDCNTQDLRNMTVAATKVNQKVPVVCARGSCDTSSRVWSVWLLAAALHSKWLVGNVQMRLEWW